MSHFPTQREAALKLNRVLAAHERRARLIAQLHEQAFATANDLSAQRTATRASVAQNSQRRKVEAWLFSAKVFLLALGCIVAVGCILVICL